MKLVVNKAAEKAKAAEAPKPAPKPETAKERMQRLWDSAQAQLHPDVKELFAEIISSLPEPASTTSQGKVTPAGSAHAPAPVTKGAFVFGKK